MNTFTVNFFLSWLKMGYTGNVPRNNVLKSFQSNLSTKVWVWFGEAYRLYFQLFFFKQPITYAYSQESPLYQMLSNLWTNDPVLAVRFFFFKEGKKPEFSQTLSSLMPTTSIGFITVPSTHIPRFSYLSDSYYGYIICEFVINKIAILII